MAEVTCHMSISLDGFVAGPNQDRANPLGEGGDRLHRWHLADPIDPADIAVRDELLKQRGAFVMGRNMFGPIRGDWDHDWRGWWGEEPPYHAPVFVLTHYPRDPIVMKGGTTFYFVTGGFTEALDRARAAAGAAPAATHVSEPPTLTRWAPASTSSAICIPGSASTFTGFDSAPHSVRIASDARRPGAYSTSAPAASYARSR